mmetsp:Transcript_8720/g.13125  ORF Transcript_8720/g.13125 Transcript_8720/m.13125 type:complete len:124 (+) Transcript_8720:40-411(+)
MPLYIYIDQIHTNHHSIFKPLTRRITENTATITAIGILIKKFDTISHFVIKQQSITMIVPATMEPKISSNIPNVLPTSIGTNNVRSSSDPRNATIGSVRDVDDRHDFGELLLSLFVLCCTLSL